MSMGTPPPYIGRVPNVFHTLGIRSSGARRPAMSVGRVVCRRNPSVSSIVLPSGPIRFGLAIDEVACDLDCVPSSATAAIIIIIIRVHDTYRARILYCTRYGNTIGPIVPCTKRTAEDFLQRTHFWRVPHDGRTGFITQSIIQPMSVSIRDVSLITRSEIPRRTRCVCARARPCSRFAVRVQTECWTP